MAVDMAVDEDDAAVGVREFLEIGLGEFLDHLVSFADFKEMACAAIGTAATGVDLIADDDGRGSDGIEPLVLFEEGRRPKLVAGRRLDAAEVAIAVFAVMAGLDV